MKPETKAFLEKARYTLDAARRDLDAADADHAVSHAYYATYYAATAAINEVDLTAKTHKGTHTFFYQQYVESGKIDEHHHHAFSRLFQLRQDVDYAFGIGILPLETATTAVEQAEAFVDAVEALLSS